MKVLFVINNFYAKGNGLSGSARRTVKHLEERGLEVKVLSGRNPDVNGLKPDFELENFSIPIFNNLVERQGYVFAKNDYKIIEDAVKWADVIHLEEPFILQNKVCKVAKKYNKTLVGTYHLHPENLFASVNLERDFNLNTSTLILWRNTVFNKCKILQCPTENVKERLLRHHFKPELRVISNGIKQSDFTTTEVEPMRVSDAKYQVITIGRHSVEKDPITLLKSMKYSKFRNDIQLVFAGRGPKTESLAKYADRLYKKGIIKYKPLFGFYSISELQSLAKGSDLYIHLAFIEVEGLSCMEAIQTGLVPLIAEYKYSATSQFALNEKSKFKARNPKDLAEKIDYWLEDDERRKAEAKKYLSMKNDYDIDDSIDKIIEMYNDALKM